MVEGPCFYEDKGFGWGHSIKTVDDRCAKIFGRYVTKP